MPNEMSLPPEIAELDARIQTLELLKQGAEALGALRASLSDAAEVTGKMSEDLAGETLSIKDFIDVEVNETTGKLDWSLNTDKIDPLALDKTELPANLVAEAIRAQQALEEVTNPFGDHNSKLLGALEKIAGGLDKGSEMFGKVQKGIRQLQRGIDLFEQAMAGELDGAGLIKAFDTYFQLVLGVFENTIGNIPGFGALLTQYGKGVSSIVPDVLTIHAQTQRTLDTIQATKTGAEITEAGGKSDRAEGDLLQQQSASLEAQIATLEAERFQLLDAHQRAEAERARREIDGIVDKAKSRVLARTGYSLDTVQQATDELGAAVYVTLPLDIDTLTRRNPDDPKIGDYREALVLRAQELRGAAGTRYEIEQAVVDEIESIIRHYPQVLQNADLRELQNRYPQLERAINDIRAGNAAGTQAPPPAPPAPPVPSSAAAAESKSRVPAIVAGGVAVAMIAGASFFFFGGSDPCEDENAFGLVPGIQAAADDDPCDDDDLAIGGDGDSDGVAVDPGDRSGDSGSDDASDGGSAGGDIGVGAAPVGKELPVVDMVTTDGVLGAFAGDTDQVRVEAGLSGIRVWLQPSTEGGKITISGGPDGEGPSGEFSPDGSGGYVWEDNAKNEYDVATNESVKDGDDVSDVRVEGSTMSFTWGRTNFDGTAWSASVSIEVPPDTKRWFESLPAPSDAPCSAEVGGTRNSDDSLTVNGTTDCEDGSRMTVFLSDGQRGVAEAQGGSFEIVFDEAERNDSQKTVASVARDCHWLNGTQIAG